MKGVGCRIQGIGVIIIVSDRYLSSGLSDPYLSELSDLCWSGLSELYRPGLSDLYRLGLSDLYRSELIL